MGNRVVVSGECLCGRYRNEVPVFLLMVLLVSIWLVGRNVTNPKLSFQMDLCMLSLSYQLHPIIHNNLEEKGFICIIFSSSHMVLCD